MLHSNKYRITFSFRQVPIKNGAFYLFSVPNKKIPEQYRISGSGLRQDGKWLVLKGRELDGTGSGWSRVLGTENFTDFFGKNPVPGKWHSGI